MPLGANKSALLGMGGAAAGGNYFGDGALGSVTTSGDVTHTVLNKSGSYDGDMLVLNYTNLVISSGDTMTVDQPCRGILLYCTGYLTVTGTLHMNLKGGFADPTASGGSDTAVVNASGLQLGMLTASGSTSMDPASTFAGTGNAAVAAVGNQNILESNGDIFSMPRLGGVKGAGCNTGGSGNSVATCTGTAGTAGSSSSTTCSTGGGGGGGANTKWQGGNGGASGGSGADAGVFGGGSGGGGAGGTNSYATGGAAVIYSGAGGNGAYTWSANSGGGGGGNPGGSGVGGSYAVGQDGAAGVGGIMWIIVKGAVSIAGTVSANGGAGGGAISGERRGGGAGSGGGAIMILHGGAYSISGSLTTSAGGGGAGTGLGGAGGAGTTCVAQVAE